MAPPPQVIRTTRATRLRQDHQLRTRHNISNRDLLLKAVVSRRVLRARENEMAMLQSSNDKVNVGTVHEILSRSQGFIVSVWYDYNPWYTWNSSTRWRGTRTTGSQRAGTPLILRTYSIQFNCWVCVLTTDLQSTWRSWFVDHHNSHTSNDTSRKEQVLDFDDPNPTRGPLLHPQGVT